jgi:hypothetical protein
MLWNWYTVDACTCCHMPCQQRGLSLILRYDTDLAAQASSPDHGTSPVRVCSLDPVSALSFSSSPSNSSVVPVKNTTATSSLSQQLPRCSCLLQLVRRQKGSLYISPSGSRCRPKIPPEYPAAGDQGLAPHATVCRCVLHHVARHVLQWLHHHLYLHWRLHRVLHLRLGVV